MLLLGIILYPMVGRYLSRVISIFLPQIFKVSLILLTPKDDIYIGFSLLIDSPKHVAFS